MIIQHFFMVRRLFGSGVSLFVDPGAIFWLAPHSVINAKLLQVNSRLTMSSTASVALTDSFIVAHDATISVTINCITDHCTWGGFYSALIEARMSIHLFTPVSRPSS
jgi:hypothetical protein